MTHATSHPGSRPSGILSSLSDAWKRYRKRRAAIAELQTIGHTELERMVLDAGVTYGDLLALARQGPNSASLLYQRLERAGIDVRAIETGVLRDLQRCCTLCESKGRCQHDLDEHPKQASWPSYCPNRPTIEALGNLKCH
jgi:hypothetical protein